MESMDKKQFIILLSSIVATVFISIFLATLVVESRHKMPPRHCHRVMSPAMPEDMKSDVEYINVNEMLTRHDRDIAELQKWVMQNASMPMPAANKNEQQAQVAKNAQQAKKTLQNTKAAQQQKAGNILPTAGIEPLMMPLNNDVKTEMLDDMYKISVNLVPFKGNEKLIKVDANGREVKINGSYHSNDKNKNENYQISQTMLLPFKFDKTKIKQYKKGDFLIIEVPELDD